jgi:sialidase-1
MPYTRGFIALISLFWACQSRPKIEDISVFTNGQGLYACYRIPAVVAGPQGTLFAFAEGRTSNCNDFGDVDILMTQSTDGGRQWSPPIVVAQFDRLQAGNPAPVWDTADPRFPKGRLFLFYNTGDVSEHQMRLGKGTRQVFYITSTDAGASWSAPTDITPWVHFNKNSTQPEKDWRTNATTPGHALQFQEGPFKGRIYIPANHSQGPPQEGFNEYRAYGFYSDDHGQTWAVSSDVPVPSSNEAIGVELPNGQLMLNIREQNGKTKKRLVALSDDGGGHWKSTHFDPALISPVCQSSVLLFKGKQDTLLLYSGPNSTEKRVQMTVKASFDLGQSWPIEKEIYSGTAAYSDLVQIDAHTLGLFYERDQNGIYFARIPLHEFVAD